MDGNTERKVGRNEGKYGSLYTEEQVGDSILIREAIILCLLIRRKKTLARSSHSRTIYAEQYPCPALFLGSCQDRGQSPVEWEDFLSVCPSVRSSIYPSVHP